MQVSLNSQPIDTPSGLTTVGEVVGFVESDVLPRQHVITKVLMDGEEVTAQLGDGEAFQRPAGDCVLEIFSARAIDVAREGLVDATRLLPVLTDELPVVSAELTGGRIRAGLNRFSRCMESISWYVNLLGAVEYILADNGMAGADSAGHADDELSPEDSDLSAWPGQDEGLLSFASVENLRQKLMDVQQAQDSNDTDLQANVIQYEILPIVQIWVRELPTLVSRVSRLGHVA